MSSKLVFRAVRKDEKKSGKLIARDPTETEMTISEAVSEGSKMPNHWVHCTKSLRVALYYAKAYPSECSAHEIWVIDLSQLGPVKVELPERLRMLSPEGRYKARNFCRKHKIVLLDGSGTRQGIPQSAVVDRVPTNYPDSQLAFQCNFDQFVRRLDFQVLVSLHEKLWDLIAPYNFGQIGQAVSRNAKEKDNVQQERGKDLKGLFRTAVLARAVNGGMHTGTPTIIKYQTNSRGRLPWIQDLDASRLVRKIVRGFNRNLSRLYKLKGLGSAPIVIICDTKLGTVEESNGQQKETSSAFFEALIPQFQKYNSNSGYEAVNDICKALSHYSYVYSKRACKGDVLLCNLKGGGREATGKGPSGSMQHFVVLSDPILMSTSIGQYGPGDLGKEGIDNFFGHHTCGKLCKRGWGMPSSKRQLFYSMEETLVVEEMDKRRVATPIKKEEKKWGFLDDSYTQKMEDSAHGLKSSGTYSMQHSDAVPHNNIPTIKQEP